MNIYAVISQVSLNMPLKIKWNVEFVVRDSVDEKAEQKIRTNIYNNAVEKHGDRLICAVLLDIIDVTEECFDAVDFVESYTDAEYIRNE